MLGDERQSQPGAAEILELMDLFQTVLSTENPEELGALVIPRLRSLMQLPAALLFVADQRLRAPHFTQVGLMPQTLPEVESQCAQKLQQCARQPDIHSLPLAVSLADKVAANMVLYPLYAQELCLGLIGFALDEAERTQDWLDVLGKLPDLVATAIDELLERSESARQLSHLNTYLTVSSMLAQSLDLHELLEMILYCCMEVASAEAASVLLLDDEKENFSFYQAEGPAKPSLTAVTFPADRGLASSILGTQQSEVINDVRGDPRFYRQVDSESGFQTKNMIAVPLVADAEKIGVLEVLNNVKRGFFIEEERLLLVSIAEEIAFAIRNAKLFEIVVNSYCKQRQGQMSCRGCERPLGSWTPCIKYREFNI